MRSRNYVSVKIVLAAVGFILGVQESSGQENPRKLMKESQTFVKKAEKEKKDGNFVMAEANYREAMGKDQANAVAHYNMGHLYGDKEMDADGMSQLFKTVKNTKDKELRHKAFHNLGNAYMKQEDYAQAVSAYKDALRNDPTDDETRYNLAIAKEKLKKNPNPDDQGDDDDNSDNQDQNDENSKDNQDQDQDQQDQDQNEEDNDNEGDPDDNNQNQDKDEGDEDEDQSGGGQDDDQEDNKDNDKDQDQGENNNDQDDSNENQQQGNQSMQDLSDEQAENLLKAAENLEKGVQEKLDVKKGKEIKGKPNRKDW